MHCVRYVCICMHTTVQLNIDDDVKSSVKKGRQTERKREECIVSAAVKNKSCASSSYCALDTHTEQ